MAVPDSQASTSNAQWTQSVQAFINRHPTRILAQDARDELRHLVDQFYQTDQHLEMQSLLADLHWRYNLTGLMAAEFLVNVLFVVNNRNIATTRERARRAPILRLRGPRGQPRQSTQPGQLPQANEATDSPPANDEQETHPRKCHPPNLEHHRMIGNRDRDWLYICDLCGHGTPQTTHFHFHERVGAEREGFRTVAVDTIARKWYGIDAHGNEYMGDMRPTPTQRSRGGNPPVGPPCGERLRVDRRARQERKKQADALKAAKTSSQEQGQGGDGGDNEADAEGQENQQD